MLLVCFFLFFQAEDGIRVSSTSRGLGDVYKGQQVTSAQATAKTVRIAARKVRLVVDLIRGKSVAEALATAESSTFPLLEKHPVE
ncbi:LSU ribosomal protein L22P [Lactobacillus brevis ATCC 367] [Lactiplantibacillus mudanjiangensis]|nr:LSU ribosomal protein L22P [Lactobacillus brevis ATCC 367] [Lactiplantibacillus mudanjiangensis]